MNENIAVLEFIAALRIYIEERLRQEGAMPEYINEAVEIVDARNALFINVGNHNTAEEDNIFALRDLIQVDADTMTMVVNESRLRAIARLYF